eukprot:COSAG04_NODE_9980_length_815_cov_0.927374_1_plen_145_part_00
MGKCGPTSNYSSRYWKQQYFDALESLRTVCEAEGVPMAEAALRWCRHHSVLSPKHGDGFIIGASSLEHAVANLDAASKGPLPEAIVTAYDEAWKITEPVAQSTSAATQARPASPTPSCLCTRTPCRTRESWVCTVGSRAATLLV